MIGKMMVAVASAGSRGTARVPRQLIVKPAVSSRANVVRAFSTSRIMREGHEDESFETFNTRYAKFFANVEDLFELQRGLNNCFAYDLVPSVQVVEEAVRAARRMDDFSTAVRIFEGLREKVENKSQYKQYLDATKELRDELGITTKEELYGQSL